MLGLKESDVNYMPQTVVVLSATDFTPVHIGLTVKCFQAPALMSVGFGQGGGPVVQSLQYIHNVPACDVVK